MQCYQAGRPLDLGSNYGIQIWGASCSFTLLFKGVFSECLQKWICDWSFLIQLHACHPEFDDHIPSWSTWEYGPKLKGLPKKKSLPGCFLFWHQAGKLARCSFVETMGAMDTTGFDWMPGRNGDGRFAPLPAGRVMTGNGSRPILRMDIRWYTCQDGFIRKVRWYAE